MKKSEYKIVYTYSSRDDIRRMKKYILDTFKYREYANNFTNKIKEAVNGLRILPTRFDTIGFQYRGYDIYMKPYRTYLIFYVVDNKSKTVIVLRVLQDGMDWQQIIKQWLQQGEL